MEVMAVATASYGSITLHCYYLVEFHIAINAKEVGVAVCGGKIFRDFTLTNFCPESDGRGAGSCQGNLLKVCTKSLCM